MRFALFVLILCTTRIAHGQLIEPTRDVEDVNSETPSHELIAPTRELPTPEEEEAAAQAPRNVDHARPPEPVATPPQRVPMMPPPIMPTRWMKIEEYLLPTLGGLAFVGAVAAGTFITPEAKNLNAFKRAAFGTSLAVIPATYTATTMSNYNNTTTRAFALPILSLPVSPLPVLGVWAASKLSDDGADHRLRGAGYALLSTVAADFLSIPLRHLYSRNRRSPAQVLLVTMLSSALMGFAASVTYSYTAGLPRH